MDVARLGGDQTHAPQDEGTHEEFAELGVGLNDRAQAILGDHQDLARIADASPHQAADSLKRAHFSGKAARRVHDDPDFPIAAWFDDFDAAREHHQHGTMAITGLRQYLAFADSAV